MIVLEICERLSNKIDEGKKIKGKVYSIFNTSVNLLTEGGDLITILDSNKPISPLSIKVDGIDYIISRNVSVGDEFYILYNKIVIRDITIIIDKAIVRSWNPTPKLDYLRVSDNELENRVKSLEKYLFANVKESEILPLIYNLKGQISPYDDHFLKLNSHEFTGLIKFQDFISAILNGDYGDICDLSKELINSLTELIPSMDDFVCGLMTTLIYLNHHYSLRSFRAYKLNLNIIKNINKRVDPISNKALKFAAIGEMDIEIRDFILTLLSKDEDNYLERIDSILKYDNLSGANLLWGIFIGFRIMAIKARGK